MTPSRAWWGISLLAVPLAGCTLRSNQGADTRPVVAVVSGDPIYVDDFERAMRQVRLDGEEGLPDANDEKVQRRVLLNDMITRRLVLHEAERMNVVVGMDDVENAYTRLHSGWTDQDFHNWLAARHTTPAELKRQLRDRLTIKKYFDENVYARVAVTDEEIADYIANHPEVKQKPEEVHARQIVVKTAAEAKKVLHEIRRGKSFEDAAMQYSVGPEGKSGGDLGFFARGSMPKIFDQVCFKLKVGQISKVVASDYGFHIFQVVDHHPAEILPDQEVRDAVEAKLRREKERQAQKAKIAELRKAAHIVIKEKVLAQIS